jgi:hypothetical protein
MSKSTPERDGLPCLVCGQPSAVHEPIDDPESSATHRDLCEEHQDANLGSLVEPEQGQHDDVNRFHGTDITRLT